ncbi:hypothetical protein [Actinosynnema sp. NPDC020468]|uniref:nSTAND1 domain-containing NTPase n=1 Tax=Actinosynnema sp. NPDC020468 TaxID=3154488 RepID=UPI0033CB9215
MTEGAVVGRREDPLEAGSEELALFARGLRELRAHAGAPTYRVLARTAHYSAAALSEAANGRRLPSLAVTLAYVRACGGDVGAWERRWRSLAAEPVPVEPGDPPYAGLAAFQVADSARFFGRDRLLGELDALVDRRRLVGVFGASGSGKSSLLRAGLAARRDPAVVLTPTVSPVDELAAHLGVVTGRDPASLAAEFRAYRENAHLRVRQALIGGDAELLLVVDQFEEVFSLCHDDAERTAFLDALVTAAGHPNSRTRVVLGVRADFLGHCGRHAGLVDALRGGQLLIGPMTARELREAIVEPAGTVGCKVENALVTRLVADAAHQPAALPLVSHALLETWRRKRGMTLTLAGYEEAGGLEHAVARTAEQVYSTLDRHGRVAARRVFLRLIAIGDGTEDAKRRSPRAEVDHPDVLEALAEARLVVLHEDTVELAHEALIRGWPRLRDWVTADREALRVLRKVTEAATAWEAVDRDPGALYRGVNLAVARDRVPRADLTAPEREFLDASAAGEDAVARAERGRTRRLRRLVVLMSVLFLLAASAAWYAVAAGREATEARNNALALKVLRDAEALRDTDPGLSVQLTLAAYRLVDRPETRDALFGAFDSPYATKVDGVRAAAVGGDDVVLVSADGSRATLLRVPGPRRSPVDLGAVVDDVGVLRAVEVDPARGWVATSAGGDVQLSRMSVPARPVARFRVGVAATSLAFSSDGEWLVAGFADEPPTAWRLTDGGATRLVMPGGAARDVAHLRDHLFLVSGGDRTSVWDVGGEVVDVAGPASAVAIGPEGRTAATAGPDRELVLWDFAEPRRPARLSSLRPHVDGTTALAFSPDGRMLVTASTDRTARVWDTTDLAAPVPVATLAGHLGGVRSVAFTGAGDRIVTVGEDDTARLVEVADLSPAQSVPAESISVARERDLVATVDLEGVLRLADISWPGGPRRLWPMRAHPGAIRSADLSPDGELLLTVAVDGSVRLWRTANPANPDLVADLGRGYSAAFGWTGRRVVVGGVDGQVVVWDAEPVREVARLPGPMREATLAALAFDGRRLAAPMPVGGLARWELAGSSLHSPYGTVAGPTTPVVALAYGPGDSLLTMERGGEVRWWRDGRRVDVATGARAFAVRDRKLAVIGTDGAVHLRDLSWPDAREVAVFGAGGVDVTAIAFDPDGRTLVGASGAAVRFWDTDLGAVRDRVCRVAPRAVSRAEWERYLPGVPYAPPCG